MEEILKQQIAQWAKEKTIYQIVIAVLIALYIIGFMSDHFKKFYEALPSIRKTISGIQRRWFRHALFEKKLMDKLDKMDGRMTIVEKEVQHNGGGSLKDMVRQIQVAQNDLFAKVDFTDLKLEAGYVLAGRLTAFFNKDTDCIDVNPVFLKRFGKTKEEMLRSGYEDMINEAERRDFLARFSKAVATGSKFLEPELGMYDSFGREHKVCVTGYPFFNRNKKDVEAYFVTFEILKSEI